MANLVEYAPGNRPIWATGTNTPGSVARMQGDGNLVIIAPGNIPVWASGTNGYPNAIVELQSDVNIVVYSPGHIARWASGSNGGNPALTERIAAIARNEAANPNHNHENGANCNFYSGALGSGTPCAGGWRAQAWCADFARWVYGQAGAATGGLDGRAASFYTYGRAHGTWKPGYNAANARVGGAVVYNLDTRGPNASHVGIVVAVNGNRTIEIISGNNSRNQVGSTGVFTPSASSGISGYVSPTHRRTSSAWLPPSRRGRCAPNSGRFTTMSASARAYSANAPLAEAEHLVAGPHRRGPQWSRSSSGRRGHAGARQPRRKR
jgi:hypothetical protein